MKKLTKKTLSEMLQKNYFVGNYKAIVDDKGSDVFYVVYAFTLVRLSYSSTWGWNVTIHGECSYSMARTFTKLIETTLEGKYCKEKASND